MHQPDDTTFLTAEPVQVTWRVMIVYTLGSIIAFSASVCSLYLIKYASGTKLPLATLLAFSLIFIPTGIYTAYVQLRSRYRSQPKSAFRAFLHSVAGSLLACALSLFPFVALIPIPLYWLLMLLGTYLPLVLASIAAAIIHLAYTEVVRDQFPPPGCRRSDGF